MESVQAQVPHAAGRFPLGVLGAEATHAYKVQPEMGCCAGRHKHEPVWFFLVVTGRCWGS